MDILKLDQPLIGVDIAPDFIRVAELELVEEQFILKNAGMVQTPEGAMDGSLILQPKKIGRALKGLLKQRKIRARRAVTAMRGDSILTRIISLPFMPHERLKTVVETEVGRYIRLAHVEKVIFYQPLEEFDDDNRRKINVLLAVARKDQSYAHFHSLRYAGLHVEAIEVGHYAVLRLMQNSLDLDRGGSVICVAVDFDAASVNIFTEGALRFNRVVDLPQSVAHNGHLSALHTEILMASHYYQLEYAQNDPIEKMALSVADPSGPRLFKKLTKSIDDFPVQYHAAFAEIRVKKSALPKELLSKIDFSFIPAVGLSMRGKEKAANPLLVDVRPREADELEKFKVEVAAFVLLLVLTLAGIFYYGTTVGGKIKNIEMNTATAQKQNEAVKENIIKRQTKINAAAPAVADFLPEKTSRLQPWSLYFDELRDRSSADIQFLSVQIDAEKGRFRIEGFADTYDPIELFQIKLNKSPYFIIEKGGLDIEVGKYMDRNEYLFALEGGLAKP